mgnify:CR=1 FL=1
MRLSFDTVYHTDSAAQTRALGGELSRCLKAGDVVLLNGDMGAGKSEFARGMARGLGVTDAVPSPSFTVMNAYPDAAIPLYHFDFYRIEDEKEIYEIGLDEQIGGDGVALIEWYERAESCLPPDAIKVSIRVENENGRAITFGRIGRFHALDGGAN